MLLIRWLLIAIIWVYLPKYSTTDFGLPNGFLANITQDFFHKSCRIYWYWIVNFALSLPQYLALKTFNNALTGNKNLPSALLFFHFPFLLLPRREAHHRTEQCNAGADKGSTFCGSDSSFYTLFSFKDQKVTFRKKNFNYSSNHIYILTD